MRDTLLEIIENLAGSKVKRKRTSADAVDAAVEDNALAYTDRISKAKDSVRISASMEAFWVCLRIVHKAREPFDHFLLAAEESHRLPRTGFALERS